MKKNTEALTDINYKEWLYKGDFGFREIFPIETSKENNIIRLHFIKRNEQYMYSIRRYFQMKEPTEKHNYLFYTNVGIPEEGFSSKGKMYYEQGEYKYEDKWNNMIRTIEEFGVFKFTDMRHERMLGSSNFFILEYLVNGDYKEKYWNPGDKEKASSYKLLELFRDVCPSVKDK